MSGELHALANLPVGKELSIPTEYEAGLAPEPFWTLWRRRYWLALGRNGSTWPCLSAHNVVTTLTMHILQYIHNRQYVIQQTKGGQAVTLLACFQECLFRISAWSLTILKFLRLSTIASEKSSAVHQITSQLLPSPSFTFPIYHTSFNATQSELLRILLKNHKINEWINKQIKHFTYLTYVP